VTASVLDEIRAGCAAVAERARSVRIDDARLREFALELVAQPPPEDADPSRRPWDEDETTLAFVVTVDAVNFGSGWFPLLRKREGRSGYRTIAGALEARFRRAGSFSARELQTLTPERCAALFDQPTGTEIDALMAHFSRALVDLGEWLERRFEASFVRMVEAAGRRAETLIGLLAEMPLYRDVSRYGELRVPFYKRAQITAWDLACAFGGMGYGRFDDLDALTLFADNLVPHVLRRAGVLHYTPELAARIDAGTRLEPGSPEEVEIRACAVVVVERCVAIARAEGHDVNAARLDGWLWNRGQSPEIKAHPRHRARSVYY
jgi:hypothetical protein